MDELDVAYAPRSPDLSAIAAPPGDFSATPIDPLEDLHPQHQQYRGSVSHISIPLTPGGEHVLLRSPRGSTAGQPSLQQYQKAWEIRRQDSTSYGGYFQSPTAVMPARRGTAAMKDEFDEDEYLPQRGGRRAKAKEAVGNGAAAAINPVNPQDIEVRTKFPVARIKRIMQADEDVGKVAQVTPVAVSKALELFMISLVTKAAAEAKTRSSKRVLASHLKNAVLKEPDKFDFLNDIVGKVADAPAAGAKNKREDESDESPNEGGPRKRRPAAAGTRSRRKKEGSEE